MSGYGRAGRYEPQPGGFRAFEPAPLPPDPPVEITPGMLAVLSRADRALGRLDGSIRTLPAPDYFVRMYVRKEAVLSSQIEGTQSSLADLLEAEAQLVDPGRPKDVEEVANYVKAMNHGLDRLGELPVSIRLIREIHAILLRGVRGSEREPGEIRQSQNWIGPAGAPLSEATFVPPPHQLLGAVLSDWERFVHATDDLPSLIKIGLAHAQFETIHPFLDGNGRLGRLLITFLLCERDILQQPVLYLSHYLRRERAAYYERLQATRDHGDWEAWLRFFLEGVASVAVESTETARAVVDLREADRRRINEHFGRAVGNALAVHEQLYSTPIIDVGRVVGLTGLGFAASNNLVGRFVEVGILREITGRARNRRFRYDDYVALFDT